MGTGGGEGRREGQDDSGLERSVFGFADSAGPKQTEMDVDRGGGFHRTIFLCRHSPFFVWVFREGRGLQAGHEARGGGARK